MPDEATPDPKKPWLGAGKPIPGGPPGVYQTEAFAKMPPEVQVGAAARAQEWVHGTYRLTEAAVGIEQHSQELVEESRRLRFWTKIMIGVTVVLAGLTAALILVTLHG